MNLSILGGGHELVFPWVRFWTPQNKSIQLGASAFWGGDSDGFLADPEDKLLGSENRHLLSTERLLEPRPGCLVLCGEPGMGKTRALAAALEAHAHPHRISLKFCDIPTWEYFLQKTRQSEPWRTWREGTHLLSLIVDGVDEGLIKIDGFVGALAGMLESEPVSRLQLVLACRSLEWPQSEGSRLLATWPSSLATAQSETSGASGIYELCPLREPEWPAFTAATSALAGLRLFTFWEELWPVLIHDTGFARRVFLSMDRMDQREFIKNIENAAPRRVGELYLYLLDLFPCREDPPTPRGRGYTPTPRMDLARMRDELPALLGSIGTMEAVDELERIARHIPAADDRPSRPTR